MKLVMDEKLKHRLIGLSVVLSLGAIFVPAMMKKSSQHIENNMRVHVELPPKPIAPNVVMTDEKDVFKTIKVARLQVPPVADNQQESSLASEDYIESVPVNKAKDIPIAKKAAEPNVIAEPIKTALNYSAQKEVKKQINQPSNKPVNDARASAIKKQVFAKAANKSISNKNIYAVQLASFSKLTNAQALVNKLQSKGYKANYIKTSSKNGVIYKVYTGHSPLKNDVVKLRTQLASSLQLNGFVVNTGVS